MSFELAVLIPVYRNQLGTLRSLRSLRDASWPVEGTVILVDDGSDPALEIRPQEWAPLHVTLVRLPANQGVEGALNAGLEAALGEGVKYIARLDAGDTIHKERLAKQVAIMESFPEVGIVASDVNFDDEEGRLLFRFIAPRQDREIRRRMHVGLCLIDPAVMLRAALFREIGPYSADYPAAEGYDLAFRFLAASRAVCISEVLTCTTLESGGLSLTRRRAQLRSKLRLQWRHFDAMEVYSYIGVGTTLLLFVVPRGVVLKAKALFGSSRV